LLLLRGDHCTHSVLIIELKIGNSLEYFLQVRSYISDFLGL
jgi:hypothetical protein